MDKRHGASFLTYVHDERDVSTTAQPTVDRAVDSYAPNGNPPHDEHIPDALHPNMLAMRPKYPSLSARGLQFKRSSDSSPSYRVGPVKGKSISSSSSTCKTIASWPCCRSNFSPRHKPERSTNKSGIQAPLSSDADMHPLHLAKWHINRFYHSVRVDPWRWQSRTSDSRDCE